MGPPLSAYGARPSRSLSDRQPAGSGQAEGERRRSHASVRAAAVSEWGGLEGKKAHEWPRSVWSKEAGEQKVPSMTSLCDVLQPTRDVQTKDAGELSAPAAAGQRRADATAPQKLKCCTLEQEETLATCVERTVHSGALRLVARTGPKA